MLEISLWLIHWSSWSWELELFARKAPLRLRENPSPQSTISAKVAPRKRGIPSIHVWTYFDLSSFLLWVRSDFPLIFSVTPVGPVKLFWDHCSARRVLQTLQLILILNLPSLFQAGLRHVSLRWPLRALGAETSGLQTLLLAVAYRREGRLHGFSSWARCTWGLDNSASSSSLPPSLTIDSIEMDAASTFVRW